MSEAPVREPGDAPRVHGPSLAAALLVMVGGTVYPPLLTNAQGRADHALMMLVFWAMSAGFVRGVGFVPEARGWRWMFSGRACALALGLAAGWKILA